MNIAIVGLGNVGRAFADLLQQRRAWIKTTFGTEARLIGACDRSGIIINRDGLDIESLIQTKALGKALNGAGAIAASPAEAVKLFASNSQFGFYSSCNR